MDLKLNRDRETYNPDLKIYIQLAHLKTIYEVDFLKIEVYLFWHEGKDFRVVKVFCSAFRKT